MQNKYIPFSVLFFLLILFYKNPSPSVIIFLNFLPVIGIFFLFISSPSAYSSDFHILDTEFILVSTWIFPSLYLSYIALINNNILWSLDILIPISILFLLFSLLGVIFLFRFNMPISQYLLLLLFSLNLSFSTSINLNAIWGVKRIDDIAATVSKKEVGKNKSGKYYLLYYNFPSSTNEVKSIRVNRNIYTAMNINSNICFQLYRGFFGVKFIDNVVICK